MMRSLTLSISTRYKLRRAILVASSNSQIYRLRLTLMKMRMKYLTSVFKCLTSTHSTTRCKFSIMMIQKGKIVSNSCFWILRIRINSLLSNKSLRVSLKLNKSHNHNQIIKREARYRRGCMTCIKGSHTLY
jgi:hypothetical protein